MSRDGAAPARSAAPLAGLLRRGHWRVAAAALLIVGAVTAAAALALLRTEVARRLELVARTAAYAVEAAVLFEDPDAAEELLQSLARREHLARVEIELADGRVLAHVLRHGAGWVDNAFDGAASRLFELDAASGVEKDGRLRAQVRLRGNGEGLAELLSWYLLGVAGAMLATMVVVVLFSRRLEARITAPLDRLAQFTRSVRAERAFDRRAGEVGILEIDALAEDFNALLAEMQAFEAELLARQARLHSRNEVLKQQAAHDMLTGLPNRAHFHERLQQAIDAAAAQGHGLGVMFVDADRFKPINDEFGHHVGDRVLVEIARRLEGALRDADLVGRLGGDEFAILLAPLADAAHAAVVAQKIDAAMAVPLLLEGGRSLALQVSTGLALFPVDATSADALLRCADTAMYAAKRARRVTDVDLA